MYTDEASDDSPQTESITPTDERYLRMFTLELFGLHHPGLRALAEETYPRVPLENIGFTMQTCVAPIEFSVFRHERSQGELRHSSANTDFAAPDAANVIVPIRNEFAWVTPAGPGNPLVDPPPTQAWALETYQKVPPQQKGPLPPPSSRRIGVSDGKPVRTAADIYDRVVQAMGYKGPTDWLLRPSHRPGDRLRALLREIGPKLEFEVKLFS